MDGFQNKDFGENDFLRVDGIVERRILAGPPILYNDVRSFQFDPYYENCALLGRQTFFVRKYRAQAYHQYYAVLDRTEFEGGGKKYPTRWISQLKCHKGYMNWAKSAKAPETGVNQPALNCGLESLLIYLCMKDDHIHGLTGFEDWRELDSYEKAGKKIKEFSKRFCKKTIYVDDIYDNLGDLTTEARNNAGMAHFYAALDAGYENFFTVSSRFVTGCKPAANNFKVCAVLRDVIFSIFHNVNGREPRYSDISSFSLANGYRWHFCLPKNPERKSCPTIPRGKV